MTTIRTVMLLGLLVTMTLAVPAAAAAPGPCLTNDVCIIPYLCWGPHGPYISMTPCGILRPDLRSLSEFDIEGE